MVRTGIKGIRDPFVLVTEEAYYLYGSDVSGGWEQCGYACYKNNRTLSDKWERINDIYQIPADALKNFWAPEVHKYNGLYYLFGTYFSSKTNHRGCSVFRSSSPEGPFVEISDGVMTPSDWDAIDGTLYIDRAGDPWMIFVHEWTSTEDGIGRMAVARLSDDLSRFVSDPVDIFKANDPSWTSKGCTDGPFIYTTREGKLLMLWSNFVGRDYCVGIAEAKDGSPDGEWIHADQLLFSKEISGNDDGGHGMVFCDRDGSMYLSIHSPNRPTDTVKEEVVFIPVYEEKGVLRCDIKKEKCDD